MLLPLRQLQTPQMLRKIWPLRILWFLLTTAWYLWILLTTAGYRWKHQNIVWFGKDSSRRQTSAAAVACRLHSTVRRPALAECRMAALGLVSGGGARELAGFIIMPPLWRAAAGGSDFSVRLPL
jgi:hypothetical protein